MVYYNKRLKLYSQHLRAESTDAERALWYHIRRKQLENIQFYRQRPIGNYIVDFYAPVAKLVIEIDGSQHFEEEYIQKDKVRDSYLNQLGLKVLRFNNMDVLENIDGVLEVICQELKISPALRADPLLSKRVNNVFHQQNT